MTKPEAINLAATTLIVATLTAISLGFLVAIMTLGQGATLASTIH